MAKSLNSRLFRSFARSSTSNRFTTAIITLRTRRLSKAGFHSASLLHTPSVGFHEIALSEKIEEELVPRYVPENFYPAFIGEVLGGKYKVVTKLGRGVYSTAWLARDLHQGGYKTLKVCTRSESSRAYQGAENELAVSAYLQTSPVQEHPGKNSVRVVLDSFRVEGPHGSHKCLIYQPLGMSFAELCNLLPGSRFDKPMLQIAIQLLCVALDYLHKNQVVHTDISPNNILVGGADQSLFESMEKEETSQPSARKTLSDRTIYLSQPVPLTEGTPVLCDLGSAQFGQESYEGEIMPDTYRAPEVILGMNWSFKVDIWSIGVMALDLFEDERRFFTGKQGILSDEQHLAEMVALLGKPPTEFLKRSTKCAQYWDAKGNWIASTPIPNRSFEIQGSGLEGEDKELLLAFVRRILTWLPEDRPTAEELIYDDFLMQAYFSGTDERKT